MSEGDERVHGPFAYGPYSSTFCFFFPCQEVRWGSVLLASSVVMSRSVELGRPSLDRPIGDADGRSPSSPRSNSKT